MITISDDQILEFVRVAVGELVAAKVRELEPKIREQISIDLDLVDEEEGIRMLRITGKDPKRTFRRLMNKYADRVEQVVHLLPPFEPRWRRRSILRLIDDHTVPDKWVKEAREGKKTPNVQLLERSAA